MYELSILCVSYWISSKLFYMGLNTFYCEIFECQYDIQSHSNLLISFVNFLMTQDFMNDHFLIYLFRSPELNFFLIVNKSLFKTKKTSYIMNWMKIKLKNAFLPSKHLSQFSCLRLEIQKKMTRQGSARDVWNISYIVCLKLLFDYFFINFLTIMHNFSWPKII